MRAFHAIGAAFLMACVTPATSHAEATTGTSAASPPAAAACDCPGVQHRHAWRSHRHMRHHARYWRHGRRGPIALAPPPAYYDPPIPSPYDSAYDRVMTQHFRPPPVIVEYPVVRGYPVIPQIRGTQPYRFAAGGAVFEYDLMADGYVPLAQRDAQRARGVAAPPR
jgi:hypothetical protein